MNPIVIVGSGLAGYTVAREFRKLDKSAPLFILSADGAGFYSKPMLSNAFAQGKQAAQLVTQSAMQMEAQLAARILPNTRVETLDTANKIIATNAGNFEYRQLVIAVGARPIRLALDGNAAEQVLSVNHIDDYASLRDRIASFADRTPPRICILGAGLIGCEFADDLAGAGHAVTLVDPNRLPLAALAAPALSINLQTALQGRGVTLRLGTSATRIDHAGNALHVTLADGTSFDADIVLSAVGLRPDLTLAQAAQLVTGRGILVDQHGCTSARDVYALGDCAEYTCDGTTRVLPYVAPLMAAARAIARTLAGQPTAIDLPPMPVMVKTPSYPMALLPAPLHAVQGGQWQSRTENGRTVSRFYDAPGLMRGFGVAPQDAKVRQELMAELGIRTAELAA